MTLFAHRDERGGCEQTEGLAASERSRCFSDTNSQVMKQRSERRKQQVQRRTPAAFQKEIRPRTDLCLTPLTR